jgi:hypothetical protein
MYIEYRTLTTGFLLFLVKKGPGERKKMIIVRIFCAATHLSEADKKIEQTVNKVRMYSLNP